MTRASDGSAVSSFHGGVPGLLRRADRPSRRAREGSEALDQQPDRKGGYRAAGGKLANSADCVER